MRKVLFWFVGLVAAALAGLGVAMFVSGRGVIGRIDRMEQAELVRMPVDLSRPGTYEGTLEHRFNVPHQDPIILIVETPGSEFADTDNVLHGLKTEMRVRAPVGGELEPIELTGGDFVHGPTLVRRRAFLRIGLEELGTYRFALEVTTGAPALAGHKQELVARYNVCRLEVLLGRLLEALAIACWIIAGIILLVLRHFHKNRRRALADSTTSGP
ncbi:MAG TPA: hypothetical protein VMZ92_10315 [Planctomycetota bacterium]|nr:hypothetical protein [Planctomycetota bacterium]